MKKGFTLVEVFLTLGIIGIIAAMTIPTMIHVTNKKATIEQLKKAASTLNHAVYNAVALNGDVSSWRWEDDEGALWIMQNFITPRLNVGFMCSGDVGKTNKNCNYKVTDLKGNAEEIALSFDAKTRVLLNDGALIAFTDKFTQETSGDDEGEGSSDDEGEVSGGPCVYGGNLNALCGIFMIDVNGAMRPNMVGKDIFFYGLHLNGSVLPYGANESEDFIEIGCKKGASGRTCAAKLINGGWDVCYNCVNPYPVYF